MNDKTTPKPEIKPITGTYTLEIEGKKCVLKALDRPTYKIVLGMVAPGAKDPRYIDAGQIILTTCWIEGDEELKDDKSDDNVALNCTACIAACDLIEIKESDLKKN